MHCSGPFQLLCEIFISKFVTLICDGVVLLIVFSLLEILVSKLFKKLPVWREEGLMEKRTTGILVYLQS